VGTTVTIRLEPVTERIYRPVPNRIEIPPHGFVQYLDHMGTDETIVEAARTSTGKGFISWDAYKRCEKCGFWGATEQSRQILDTTPCTSGGLSREHKLKEFPRGDNGILEYMYKNKHETPAEMPVYRVLIKAPILYWRQRHRHRAASYNEQSARYMQLPGDFYAPQPHEVLGVSKSNKQGSAGEIPLEHVQEFLKDVENHQKSTYALYDKWLGFGIAPETARQELPVSIYSVGIAQTNLRMGLHHLGLRDDSHAQNITQQYARAEAAFVQALFPRWYSLYEEHTKYAVTLSRSERERLKTMLNPEDLSDDEVTKGIWKKVFP
jgi:thymidylate synthase (FAD)